MKNILWLDDLRNPFLNLEGRVPKIDGTLIWVLNYHEFTMWIEKNGLPDLISFDHDLAFEHYTPEHLWKDYQLSKEYQDSQNYKEKTGYDCAKWLCDYCLENKKNIPEYYVHSANPVGAENIIAYLTNFTKHCVV
jgi:hypothetical protein